MNIASALVGGFRILYIDPPWLYYGDPNKYAACGKHYEMISFEDLCKMPVRKWMHKKSVLFMWGTCPKLDLPFKLIEAWGLHYRGVPYIWIKTTKRGKIITGRGPVPTLVKPNIEQVLAATTVKYGRPFPIHTLKQSQLVFAPIREHSRKPDEVRDRIVELCGELPRAELFATETFPGWFPCGNQIGKYQNKLKKSTCLEGNIALR